MMREQTQTGALMGCPSRREVLRGLAGFMITMSLGGCAQSLSSSSTSVPIPTPRPRGSILYTYRGHTNRVTTVAWSPNGKYIASGSLDQTVQVWAANPGEHVQPFIYHGHTDGVQTVAWSPDSNRVVSGSIDKTVQILDAATGNNRYTYRGHTDVVSSVSWSPDGKHIVSGSWDKTVQVWDAATGAVVYIYSGYNVQAAQLNPTKGVLPDLIFAVAWSHNGKRIAAVTQVYCGDLCAVMLSWDAYTERNFSSYLDVPVLAMAWSPDDTRFVTSIVVSTQGLPKGGAPQDGSFVQISQA